MSPSTLSSHRQAISAAFGAQGLVFVTLTTRLPAVQDRWRLGEIGLSLLLLAMILLAGVGSLLAERVAARRSSAFALRAGLLLVALSLLLGVLAPTYAVFVTGVLTYGVALGIVDATSNMQAVALEHLLGRPVLPSFHGWWTAGGILGAGFALSTAALPLSSAAVVAFAPTAVAFAPFLARVESGAAGADTGDQSVPETVASALRWRPVLLVGAGLVAFYMVDTASQTWGPTYLDTTLAAPRELVALAVFPYLIASLIVRLAGDRLVLRHGAVRVLRVGAVLAAIALGVVVTAPTWPVAVAGFTLLGLGISVVAPLSFSAAAALASDDPTMSEAARTARVDAVIARFNQFNYLGALLGAVLTGLIGAGSLRWAYAVPMVLVLALWPLAPAFAGPKPPGGGRTR